MCLSVGMEFVFEAHRGTDCAAVPYFVTHVSIYRETYTKLIHIFRDVRTNAVLHRQAEYKLKPGPVKNLAMAEVFHPHYYRSEWAWLSAETGQVISREIEFLSKFTCATCFPLGPDTSDKQIQ